MSTPETPLFVKTHDFLLWLIRHTQRFPKNLRQSYTLKLELMTFDFQEAILMGNAVRGPARSNWLATADGKLVCLRALLLRRRIRGIGRRKDEGGRIKDEVGAGTAVE